MDDLAVEQVRHGRQADVRVRRDVEAVTRRERAIHLVEERERADHPARRGRKDTPDRDAPRSRGRPSITLAITGSALPVQRGSVAGWTLIGEFPRPF